ncbi:lipopolysaccharide biosynthesis protein, partial [Candidatus Latescibacterota bacterium]
LTGIYRSIGMYARGVMLGNVLALLELLFVICGLMLNFGMAWIAFLQIIPFILIVFYIVIDIQKKYPEFDILSFNRFSFSLGKTFLKPSLHFLLISLSLIITVQGIVQIIGITLGAVPLVLFSTKRTIVNTMKQLMSILTFSAWPEIIRLHAQNENRKLYVLFRAILRTTMTMSLFFFTVFYLFGSDIYRLWLGDKVEYNKLFMVLLLIYLLQSIFWTTLSHFLMAVNKHIILSRVMFFSAFLTITLSFILGKQYGLSGVIIALIAGDLLLPFWIVPYLVNKQFQLFSLKYYMGELLPIFAGISCVMITPWSIPVVFTLSVIWWKRSLPKDIFLLKRFV